MRPQHVSLLAALAAAALPLAGAGAPPTRAADPPGDASTPSTLAVQSRTSTSGLFERPGDVDWHKVRLVRGRDYAVRFNASFGPGLDSSATLRDPRRRPIRTIRGDGQADAGFEVRAAATGNHFVDLRDLRQPGSEPPAETYSIAVTPDCRDAASTTCRLEIGRPYDGLCAWHGDHDRFALTLDGSRSYAFTATTAEGFGISLEVLDQRGTVLRRLFAGNEAVIAGFRPPASGRYYLRVNANSDDYGLRYRIVATLG
jgi:hypothetical protein